MSNTVLLVSLSMFGAVAALWLLLWIVGSLLAWWIDDDGEEW